MGRERYWSRSFKRGEKETAGCMSGVLQFFDFHQLQYCYMPPQQQSQASKPEYLQGLEGQRNSVELYMDKAPSSTSAVDDIHVGMQLHPGQPGALERDLLSETSSLQGSRTLNVVARLMGLDILPDQESPRTSSSAMRSHHPYQSHRSSVQRRDGSLPINESTRYHPGIRSLPDTPRISSGRRSDVGPRLSLQLNKDNIDIPEFNNCRRSVTTEATYSSAFSSRKSKIKDRTFYDENRSPSSYAKAIVKQVKESVGRRVGLDITNTASRSKSGDESISPTVNTRKMRKAAKVIVESKQSKPLAPSRSPRLGFLETKTKRMETQDLLSSSGSPKTSPSPRPHSSPSPLSTPSTSMPSSTIRASTKSKSKPLPKSTAKCKKASCERFTQQPSASSQTARKKCKIPISSNLLVQIHRPSNVNRNPIQTVVNSLLPSGSSQQHQRYDEQQQPKQSCDNRDSGARTTVTSGGEFGRYVKRILERTGIDNSATVSSPRWFSPSHPLDPSIFHHLEHSFQAFALGPLHHRCNRRLLFNLVDEILHNAIKPHLGLRPWFERRNPLPFSSKQASGEQLLERLLLQLRSFPLAKCETLQDIDGLVGLDLALADLRGCACLTSLDKEAESLVFQMEHEILDSLLDEMLLTMMVKTSLSFNCVIVKG